MIEREILVGVTFECDGCHRNKLESHKKVPFDATVHAYDPWEMVRGEIASAEKDIREGRYDDSMKVGAQPMGEWLFLGPFKAFCPACAPIAKAARA